MNEFSFTNVYEGAWSFTKRHGLMFAVAFLVLYLITWGVQTILTPAEANAVLERVAAGKTDALMEYYQLTAPASIISGIIALILELGILSMALNIVKGTHSKFDINAFKLPLKVYGKFIVVSILLGLIIYVGIICLIIPGLYLGARLMFAPIALLDDHECGAIESIKRSWAMTSGHAWTLVGIILSFIVVAIVGLFCLIVGVFFAIAFILFAEVVAYDMLKAEAICKQ